MEYYRRIALAPDFGYPEADVEEEVPDDVYVQKMENILSSFPSIGVPPEPSMIYRDVYVGTSANAENIAQLKQMGITYILNCAGTGGFYRFKRFKDLYTPDTGVMGYQELIFDDDETTNARLYFEKAHAFIDYGRNRNAKVLIFCPGVSRSGVIALSFLIRNNIPLLKAVRTVKDLRRVVLSNEAFMHQLVKYARERRMLDPDVAAVRAPVYGRKIDRHRISSAHLPMFL